MARRIIVQTPDSPSRRGWAIDADSLLAAKEFYGVELPIVVRYTAGQQLVGSHKFRRNPFPHHKLTISQDHSLEDSNNTLWHEFRHAMQAEQWAKSQGDIDLCGAFYRLAYRHSRGPWGSSYHQNSYEVDARDFADSHSSDFLIIQIERDK